MRGLQKQGADVEKDLALIEQFLDALWLEKNLADNTISAYRRDLTLLVEWLAHRELGLENAQSDDLQGLLAERIEGGYKATSSARLLSAMRRLFQHLYREKSVPTIPARCWPRLNSRSVCRKISAKHKLRDYYSRRRLTCRWSYAIKPCLSYCMLPVCVFLS
jgi:site-specific recombinase XerC